MPQPLQPDVETWRNLTTAPKPCGPWPEGLTTEEATQTGEPQGVTDAKKTLHRALTLCLNKLVCPLILKLCWNKVVKDRPLTYPEAAAICIGAATLNSFASFSSD